MAAHPFVSILSGFHFLECPRWHDSRLWLSDFLGDQVLATDLRGNVDIIATIAGEPAGLGWLPDGRLLIVSRRGRKVMRLEPNGTLVLHGDVSAAPGRSNDMAVDAAGRAYVSSFGFEPELGEDVQPGHITRIDLCLRNS